MRTMTHPITLYREEHGLTLEAFAALLGNTNKSVVLKWERGALPRRELMQRIEEATKGAVTRQALFEASYGRAA